ncbi:hypothetical protein BDN70DRAFT_997986 [Pholiota conissans]|uniref:BTB domain-containing protein n=1 Tax=Pholiota conissans TaxID=109636 RepID=A0A9P5YP54_9AGAR|nr:hypothetical protein BDN70DRAFT_997986 [Pholiota conissans]
MNTTDTTSARSITTTSSLFRSPTANIEFISSSNTLFKLHSTYLAPQTSAGLARLPTGSLDISKPVRLTEGSEVLEILFQFIEPPPSDPNGQRALASLEDADPTLFFAVAEAAEKYSVSSAISACHARMEQLLADHPLEILNHSTLHNHPTLADKAAYQALSHPLSSTALKLTAPGLLSRYITYSATWLYTTTAILALFTSPTTAEHPCPRSAVLYAECHRALPAGPIHAIARADDIIRETAVALDVDAMQVRCLGLGAVSLGERDGDGDGDGDGEDRRCACEIDIEEVEERVRRMVAECGGLRPFSAVRVGV